MNTPNKLTLLRIVLVPFFVLFLLLPQIPHHYLLAGIVFAIAAITDHFDGRLARKHNQITDFGKFADPLADKILVMAAFLCFVQDGLLSAVAVIIMLFREFMVTSVRLVAVEHKKVIAANLWGKAKTVSQIFSIILVIVLQYIGELMKMGFIPVSAEAAASVNWWFLTIGEAAVWISVALTVISGAIYLWDNREFVKNAK